MYINYKPSVLYYTHVKYHFVAESKATKHLRHSTVNSYITTCRKCKTVKYMPQLPGGY